MCSTSSILNGRDLLETILLGIYLSVNISINFFHAIFIIPIYFEVANFVFQTSALQQIVILKHGRYDSSVLPVLPTPPINITTSSSSSYYIILYAIEGHVPLHRVGPLPLVVDANAVLAFPVTFQCFQLVAWRDSQVI